MRFKAQNIEELITKTINLSNIGIPRPMILREMAQNGIEANLRKEPSLPEDQKKTGYVLFKRDHEHKNKLCVLNTKGDFLSEKVARENLATIANSGNKNVENDYSEN